MPIADLRLVPRGGACDLQALLADTGWTEAIVKPAVSASAYRTWRSSAVTPEVSRERLREMLADGDAIVQRFVPEIVDGEWSLVFVEAGLEPRGRRKRPRAGEFRTQS